MVGLLSVLGVSGMITLVGFGWYLTIEKQLSKAFDIEIFDDEEELKIATCFSAELDLGLDSFCLNSQN